MAGVPREQQSWLSLTTSGGVTLLLGSACLLALLLQRLAPGGHSSWSGTALVALITAALLGLDWQLARRYGEQPPPRVAAGAVALSVLLVEAISLLDGLTYTAILYLALPFPAFFLLGRRAGLLVSGGLLAWMTLKFALLKPGWLQDPATLSSYLLFAVALILIVAMAQVVQRERANRQRAEELLADLERSHAQLARYAEQVAALAASEERNRLARDIHDSLGHALTVIGVQLEKALLVHDDSPLGAMGAVGAAKSLADQALADVRHSVGALRQEQQPFSLRPALEELRANLAGLPLALDLGVRGDEARYSNQQLAALYRAAQEGLTNIQKHARARRATLHVDLGEQAAVLCLVDDGVGFAGDPFERGGFGLRGLRERLELVSGRLVVTAAPGQGTQLAISIPRRREVGGSDGDRRWG
jgi:signal transduction histidine kinase